MTRDEIRKAVLDALLKAAPEARPASLRPGEDLREQLEIDSYDFLNFVIALDHGLSVAIPESDYRKLATLDSSVDYLAARMEQLVEKGARR